MNFMFRKIVLLPELSDGFNVAKKDNSLHLLYGWNFNSIIE